MLSKPDKYTEINRKQPNTQKHEKQQISKQRILGPNNPLISDKGFKEKENLKLNK